MCCVDDQNDAASKTFEQENAHCRAHLHRANASTPTEGGDPNAPSLLSICASANNKEKRSNRLAGAGVRSLSHAMRGSEGRSIEAPRSMLIALRTRLSRCSDGLWRVDGRQLRPDLQQHNKTGTNGWAQLEMKKKQQPPRCVFAMKGGGVVVAVSYRASTAL